LLAVVIFATLAAAWMTGKVTVLGRAPAGKPAQFLVERAKEILRKAGYAGEPADTAFGFSEDSALLDYIEKTDKSPIRWNKLASLTPIRFWYRESSYPLEH